MSKDQINEQAARRRFEQLSPTEKNSQLLRPVGNLAVSDLMQLMSSLMDEKIKNLPTKQDVEVIKVNVTEIATNVNLLKIENDSLKAEVQK